MAKRLIVSFMFFAVLMLPAGVVSAHVATPRVVAHHSTAHVPLTSCSQDGCDGQLPVNCSNPIRVGTTQLIDSKGVFAGDVYLYKAGSNSNCQYAAWGSDVLESGYGWSDSYHLYVDTIRTNSDEYKDVFGLYASELEVEGIHADSQMLGWEPAPHATDCFYPFTVWIDHWNKVITTNGGTFCFN